MLIERLISRAAQIIHLEFGERSIHESLLWVCGCWLVVGDLYIAYAQQYYPDISQLLTNSSDSLI